MNANPLELLLNKEKNSFTKSDLVRFIKEREIRMVNFRYCGGDGRLKTLNFVISNENYLDELLTTGERVDGSSLFPFIEAGSSDLYVMPRYRTAFLNPVSEIPSLDILCSYYDKDGNPLASSPEYILKKAHKALQERTGYAFEAMGEMEFYVISQQNDLYPAFDQKGYHESSPFIKFEQFRMEAMLAIAAAGGQIKYGHSEVGNFALDGQVFEQNEIEFLPVNVEDAADQLVIAKWIIRSLAYKHGLTVTFAPKITTGKAGSGMHIHNRLMKQGRNAMIENARLSDVAKRAIAGYLDLAPSLTAFGNTNPTSYFRLVPHQEAPTTICWGDRNRSVLVRVPLGWQGNGDMLYHANPHEPREQHAFTNKQTVEFRSPDGSADVYLLLAGLTVAARHGLEMADALTLAEKSYVGINIFDEEHKKAVTQLNKLPYSCYESALQLAKQSEIYKELGIFPQSVIDGTISQLMSYNDKDLRQELQGNNDKLLGLVNRFFHCG